MKLVSLLRASKVVLLTKLMGLVSLINLIFIPYTYPLCFRPWNL